MRTPTGRVVGEHPRLVGQGEGGGHPLADAIPARPSRLGVRLHTSAKPCQDVSGGAKFGPT